jgi:calcium-dependent protein kinase
LWDYLTLIGGLGETLPRFSLFSTFKNLAVQIIAEHLSVEEIDGLKDMFKSMDTNGSGSITFEELKAGLHKLGSQLSDQEVRLLMESVSSLPFLCFKVNLRLL